MEKHPRVPFLPATRQIAGLGDVTVAHYTEDDIEAIYALASGAAARGEDIGTDEYPTLDSWMKKILDEDYCAGLITIKNNSRELQAAIRFHSSRFSRSYTPCHAEVKLMFGEGLKNVKTHQEIALLAIELVKECGAGYGGCSIETFIHSHDSIKALRRAHMHITCTIPVIVKAPKIGLTESVIFYKEFEGVQLPEVSYPEEEASEKGSVEALLANSTFPQMDFLPVYHPALSDGRTLLVRNATKDDVLQMYEIFKAASESGIGYSVDEFPDLHNFITSIMCEYYSGIIQDAISNEIVGFFQFAQTVFRRSPDSPMADCHVAINPKIIGRGMGKDVGDMVMRCAAQSGFQFMISDTLVLHTRIINITRRMNFRIIGTVPIAAYIEGNGWEDCIYMLNDLTAYPKLLAGTLKNDKVNGEAIKVVSKL